MCVISKWCQISSPDFFSHAPFLNEPPFRLKLFFSQLIIILLSKYFSVLFEIKCVEFFWYFQYTPRFVELVWFISWWHLSLTAWLGCSWYIWAFRFLTILPKNGSFRVHRKARKRFDIIFHHKIPLERPLLLWGHFSCVLVTCC
jgi:hypothetical protein